MQGLGKMIVKYTNLAKRFMTKKSDYISAFESVIESGQFIGGNSVSNFEQGVANFLNINHVAGGEVVPMPFT